MKKLIAALLTLAVSLPAFAQWGGFYSSKAGGGGCTAGSACSGTTIAATTQFAAPAGTVSVPAITLAGDASGWYRNASNQWTWTNSTDPYLSIFQSGTSRVRLHPSMAISWTASTSVTAEDTVISRYAAKQLMISGEGWVQTVPKLAGF